MSDFSLFKIKNLDLFLFSFNSNLFFRPHSTLTYLFISQELNFIIILNFKYSFNPKVTSPIHYHKYKCTEVIHKVRLDELKLPKD